MKIFSKISILLLSILVAILIILPSLIELKSVQINLQNKLTRELQTDFNIESNISLSLFPNPKVIINDASVKNLKIEDGFIDLKFSHISITPKISSLFGQIEIKKIFFDKVSADYIISYQNNEEKKELNYIPEINQDFIANKIFNFNSESKIFDLTNIPEVIFSNSNFAIKDINGTIFSNYEKLQFESYSNLNNGQITAKGSFISDDIPTIFNLNISTDNDDISELTINSPILEANISGKFFDTENLSLTQSNFDGRINLSISNLKLLLDKYFSRKDLIFKNINNTDNINISSNLLLKDGIINIEQINIESDIIKGSGEIIARPNDDNKFIESKIEIDYLNFDDLWLGRLEAIKDEYLQEASNSIISNFQKNKKINHDKFPKLDVTIFGLFPKAIISIKEFRYNDQILKDFNIELSTKNKKQILLENLEFNLNDTSTLKLNAIIENIASLINIKGNLLINSSNMEEIFDLLEISKIGLKKEALGQFQLKSEILILPNSTIFKKLKSVLNNESIISGDLSLEKGDDILNITHNYNINNFNIDKYFANIYFERFIKGKSFLENFIFLNKLDSNHQINLFFNLLSYEDFFLRNQSLKANITRGVIEIPALTINKNQSNSKINFFLDVYSPIPILNLSIKSDQLSINNINEEDLDNKFQSNFLNYFFDFPSLTAFDGNIDFNIKELIINDLKLENLILDLPFKEGVSKIAKANANIFNGNIEISGDIVFGKSKRLSNSFILSSIENERLLDFLFDIDNIDSRSNITGVITSFGQNKSEFIENLNLQSQFNSLAINIHKFGIGDLLRKLNKTPKSITNIEDVVFSNSAKTFLKEVTGNLDIKPNNKKKDFYISTKSLGLNSVINGKINLGKSKINMSYNAVMMVLGPKRKPFPLRFALNASGKINNLKLSPNFSQIKQYLKIK
jgi:hypothetical protein